MNISENVCRIIAFIFIKKKTSQKAHKNQMRFLHDVQPKQRGREKKFCNISTQYFKRQKKLQLISLVVSY